MEGFFNAIDTQVLRGDETSIKKKKAKRKIKIYTCADCNLKHHTKNPHQLIHGKGKKAILIIGTAPTKKDDRKNALFSDDDGDLLKDVLDDIDVDLERDCWYTSALRCALQPAEETKYKDPKDADICACRQFLLEDIERLKPSNIIVLGKFAFKSLLGHRMIGRISSVSFDNFIGWKIPDQELSAYVIPTYELSFISYLKNKKPWEKVQVRDFKRHIKSAFDGAKFYRHNYKSDCIYTQDKSEAIGWIENAIKKGGAVAFDYETNCIKPHKDFAKITCLGFSDGLLGYSFPNFADNDFQKTWKKFLLSKRTKLIAHNNRFEDQWSWNIFGVRPKNWEWDTELGAHCMRSRMKTQLKLWTYLILGVLGFDDKVAYYIESVFPGDDPKSDYRRNLMEECPMDIQLEYNAQDNFYTYKLYEYQVARLKKKFKKGLNLFLEGNCNLLTSTEAGIHIDVDLMNSTEKKIQKRLDYFHKRIYNSDIIKNKWNKSRPFKISSSHDVRHLVYNILGEKVQVFTDNDEASTDKNALKKVQHNVVKDILEWRRWDKGKNTYIAQFKRELNHKVIHPYFNLGTVDTFRGSSNSPNFQNNPKRDKEIMNYIRSLIIPSPGNFLKEWDYKSIEVIIAACYCLDPNLLKYVTDSSTDMHRDMCMQIFFRDLNTFRKEERQIAKSFVFAEFYGDYYEQVAKNIWNMILEADLNNREKWEDKTIRKHLKNEGINNLADFTEHLRIIEDDFWGNRFAVYNEFNNKLYKDYQKKGYVDLHTGFRVYGPMRKNQVINTPIQGSAFHCLLYTINRLYEKLPKYKSIIPGQIHDAIFGDISPDEEQEIDYWIWYYGTQEIREHWDWICVPLTMEAERSEIDGSWAQMKDAGTLSF